MRLFIAAGISGAFLEQAVLFQKRLKSCGADVKWVERDKMHFTFHFLGEMQEEKLPSLRKCVDAAAKLKSFVLQGQGISFFPENSPSPRIIWLGVEDKSRSMQEIWRLTGHALAGEGFSVDSRPFSPHLTLGRFRSRRSAEEIIAKAEKLSAPQEIASCEIDRVSLFESRLFPQGPVYTEIYSVQLSKTGAER